MGVVGEIFGRVVKAKAGNLANTTPKSQLYHIVYFPNLQPKQSEDGQRNKTTESFKASRYARHATGSQDVCRALGAEWLPFLQNPNFTILPFPKTCSQSKVKMGREIKLPIHVRPHAMRCMATGSQQRFGSRAVTVFTTTTIFHTPTFVVMVENYFATKCRYFALCLKTRARGGDISSCHSSAP